MFANEAKKAVEEIIKKYNSVNNKRALHYVVMEELKKYNLSVKKAVLKELHKTLEDNYTHMANKGVVVSGVELSDMLHKNAISVGKEITKVIHDAMKSNKTIRSVAKKLYEGYNFKDKEMIDTTKALPKYLFKVLKGKGGDEAVKLAKRLKTTNLKIAYRQLLENLEELGMVELHRYLKTAYHEKMRYYANRIAQTELHRATMAKRAKEILDDKEVEFVRYEMSASHPRLDICDFYAGLDVGYGAGIVKKEDMRTLPAHPHCKCVYSSYYGDVKKGKTKSFRKASRDTMEKFSDYEKRAILGSYRKLFEFEGGKDIEAIFNSIRPKYKIKRYVDVLGYNGGMKKVFSERTIEKDEREAIAKWTDDSSEIKKVMWGIGEDKQAKKYATTLFSLFDKYESNLEKGTKLYRGMSFTEEMFKKFNYDKITKDEIHTPDDEAIVSFSTNKKKAFKYATMTDRKYKVVYILENEAEALDISKISAKPEEKESIITKGKEYLVTYTRIFNRGDEIWKIIKLKKEK